MNKNLFAFMVGGFFLLALTGCESARNAPSETAPRGEIRALEPSPAPSREDQLLTSAAAQPPAPVEGDGWRLLFDGKSLAGSRQTPFESGGRVEVRNGLLVFWMGEPFVGVNYTNEVPKVNYEVTFEAMRCGGIGLFLRVHLPGAGFALQSDCGRLGRWRGRHIQH